MSAETLCIACSSDPLPVEWCDAWGEYRAGLERMLHAFKFGRHDFLDEPLAELLEGLVAARRDRAFDVIVPVPMHRAKRRRRGYNQAELLGVALGKRIGVRCQPEILTKLKEKQTQSTLARAARAENVRGVFTASHRAAGRSLLLVDDVCTTGETLRSCARSLLAAGASRVCALSVAKAI